MEPITDAKDMYPRIVSLLVEMFEIEAERIKPNSTLRGALMLDSVDLVALVTRLESDFGLSPDLDGYRNVMTVKQLASFVSEQTTST